MKAVLVATVEKKQAFATTFAAFLRDDTLEPERRLALFPCTAH